MRSKKREQYFKLDWLCANYPVANRVHEALQQLNEMSVSEIDVVALSYERLIERLSDSRNPLSDKLAKSLKHHFGGAISVLRLARIQKSSKLHMKSDL